MAGDKFKCGADAAGAHMLEGLEAALREDVHQVRRPRRVHRHRQLVPPPLRTAAPCACAEVVRSRTIQTTRMGVPCRHSQGELGFICVTACLASGSLEPRVDFAA